MTPLRVPSKRGWTIELRSDQETPERARARLVRHRRGTAHSRPYVSKQSSGRRVAQGRVEPPAIGHLDGPTRPHHTAPVRRRGLVADESRPLPSDARAVRGTSQELDLRRSQAANSSVAPSWRHSCHADHRGRDRAVVPGVQGSQPCRRMCEGLPSFLGDHDLRRREASSCPQPRPHQRRGRGERTGAGGSHGRRTGLAIRRDRSSLSGNDSACDLRRNALVGVSCAPTARHLSRSQDGDAPSGHRRAGQGREVRRTR